MSHMLHLLYTVLKYSLSLILLRLVVAAFGWEFGVSRQYLRVLELILYLGQKRIERVESEHKLLSADQQAVDGKEQSFASAVKVATRPHEEAGGFDKEGFHDASSTAGDSAISNGNTIAGAQKQDYGERMVSSALEAAIPASLTKECSRKVSCLTRPTMLQAKTRRISTPRGPPVFLLDDDDDEEDDNNNHDDDYSNNNNNNTGDDSSHFGYSCCDGNNQRQQEKTGAGKLVQNNNQAKREFQLDDINRLVAKGISAIIDDQVTKRFQTEELKTWNLLTRTNAKNYQFKSRSIGFCWLLGFLVRYILLLPLRIMFTLAGGIWLLITMFLVGLLPESLRNRPYYLFSLMSFRILSCGITSSLKFHNRQFRAKEGEICVANHTSPIDILILACDNCYALVGQRHDGVLGILERALSRAANHIWFEREEIRDRKLVTLRLREHVNTKTKPPVLIFPEGTCINNSAVMLFRKGAFETTNRVCPVAIKYDRRFGDPFWNSTEQSYVQYILLVMSSWAIKCDVWYLPPMEQLPNESAAEFANRVKSEIARQGGLVDLAWDGQLKRTSAKVEWKYQQQEDFVNRLKLE